MYANYFGFRDTPFTQLADSAHVFVSAEFEAARMELLEAIQDKARLVLLTGHAGTGKSKLLSHLQTRLDEARPVFSLPSSALVIEEFIGVVASTLDIHLHDGSDIFSSLQEGLIELREGDNIPVLLIDEAHSLGCDVLENLIELFQLGPGEQPLAQLVLVANPEIEYTLQRPELRELEENLARLSRLLPLRSEEIEPYIQFALRIVGYQGEPVFTAEAMQAIANHTWGIPQLINTLCGASLLLAYGREENPVTASTVEDAIEEVAGFAMDSVPDIDESSALDTDEMAVESIWSDELEDELKPRPLPSIVQAWLKRSRRWPIATVGVGGSVALVAILILIGTVPFDEHTANARQHDLTNGLNARVTALRNDVASARGERDRLRVELAARIEERNALAERLAVLETRREMEVAIMAEPLAEDQIKEPDPTVSSNGETAEDLLAELMRSAESEANAVTGALAETAPGNTSISYKVQAGDTVWGIANRHGITVKQLLAANKLSDANKVIVGRSLTISRANVVAVSPKTVASQDAEELWYVVRPGDSLYGIGRKFESSVDDLLRWNQLADADQLFVGQRLRLNPL